MLFDFFFAAPERQPNAMWFHFLRPCRRLHRDGGGREMRNKWCTEDWFKQHAWHTLYRRQVHDTAWAADVPALQCIIACLKEKFRYFKEYGRRKTNIKNIKVKTKEHGRPYVYTIRLHRVFVRVRARVVNEREKSLPSPSPSGSSDIYIKRVRRARNTILFRRTRLIKICEKMCLSRVMV